MQKVLIISYFYPPCGLTAGQRIEGWAKYLHCFGYKPIIVTRYWDKPVSSQVDGVKSLGKHIRHDVFDSHEVYYVPYRQSFRDFLYIKFENTALQKMTKLFTFFRLLSELYFLRFTNYYNMFKQAKKVVVENSISKVIVSGNPFCQFWFGYKLHRQPNVKWIADYRDDWTTSSLTPKLSFLQRVLLYLQQKKEKEWVGTANYITSISELYVKKVSALVGRPGFVLLNGYEVSSDLDLNVLNQSKRFIITYSGTLYPTQPIEPIIKIICRLINEGYHELFVRFPGISYDEIQKNRVKSIVDSQGMNQNFELTNRVSREKVIDMQLQSDLLLMISHENIKGIPSSKLYEYIALERTILLYPGDNDIIDATLKDVGLGIICDTEEQLYNTIKSKLEEKRKLGVLPKPSFNTKGKQLYSRRNQVEVLSKILNKL